VGDEIGVLVPLAFFVAFAVALFDLFLLPDEPRSIRQHFAALRAEPVLARSHTAAMAPLAILSFTVWTIANAHLARALLAEGGAAEAGIELALASLATLAAIAACALAVLRPLRRALASGAESMPRLLDPVTTGGIALVLGIAVFAYGVSIGEPGGDTPGVLGVLGVLKRHELDLRPVVDLLAIAVGAYAAPIAFARPRASHGIVILAVLIAFAPLLWTAHVAKAMNADANEAQAIERGAPLGKIALAVLRKATDRDHDGASAYFGGGDCNDHDKKIGPNAIDVPGNGVDEDCTGADLPIAEEIVPPKPSTNVEDRLPDDFNLVLITVDTLRLDEGFMGYDLPTTPNLDALAKDATVFERAYAMASYTGKSVAPLMIGKYPSETIRDGKHFTNYANANTFLAERLKKAGFKTFGAASHWYFSPWSGLQQGFDTFDLSAKPASGQGDTDSSITSPGLSDAALKMLAKPENTSSGRFFMWLHYFDPHAQYLAHEGAPDFHREGAKGGTAEARAAYDAEVWFTDHHIGSVLDAIKAAEWGKKTVVVLTSDHGEAFADHGMNWHGGEIWESLVRVPLFIYVPGVKAHRVPVKRSHIDLVPTLLDVLRLPQPPAGELSGTSMIGDVLTDTNDVDGGTSDYPERDILIDMPLGPYTGMRRAILHGPTPGMKLIHFGGSNYNLYDLAADPAEADDLARDKAQFQPVFSAFQAMRSRMKELDPTTDPTARE
ncbi:MAG TPA: sulfatase-like hydrolase/transferase, partial [Polyangiaceae bacterium]